MRTPIWLLLLGLAACGGTTTGGALIDASASDGIAPADGGDGGNRGDGAVHCSAGTANFAVTGNGAYCVSYCQGWLTILDPNGAPLSLEYCGMGCDTCQARGCSGACAAPMPVPDGGVTRSWDGTSYSQVASGTCGGGTQCYQTLCAAPGRYTARMCLYKNVGDGGVGPSCLATQTPTCTDVPFDWPMTGTVSGTVGP